MAEQVVVAATTEQVGPVPTEETPQVNAEQSESATPTTAGGEDEQATPEEGESEHEQRRKSGYQREKERRLRAEQEREFWRTQALKGTSKPDEKPSADAKPWDDPKDPKPKISTFHGTLEEYEEAKDEWFERQTDRKQAYADEQREYQAKAKQWQEKKKSIAQSLDDYDEAAEATNEAYKAIQGQPGFSVIDEFLADIELGPQMVYELGKDPAEMERIASLPPAQAARELAKIEARLAGDNKAEKAEKPGPPKTKAPKPPTPVNKSANTDKFDPNDPKWAERLTTEEWIRQRNADLAKRGR